MSYSGAIDTRQLLLKLVVDYQLISFELCSTGLVARRLAARSEFLAMWVSRVMVTVFLGSFSKLFVELT